MTDLSFKSADTGVVSISVVGVDSGSGIQENLECSRGYRVLSTFLSVAWGAVLFYVGKSYHYQPFMFSLLLPVLVELAFAWIETAWYVDPYS